jgi:hypothetical protein
MPTTSPGPAPAHAAAPRAGDVLLITQAASVQFAVPILFRVIRPHDWSTSTGWIWLDGYQLNAAGDAVARRSIYVQIAGLHAQQPNDTVGRSTAFAVRRANSDDQQ